VRVTLHLTTGDPIELDLDADEADALGVAVAEGHPRTVAGPLWRRKGSTSTGQEAIVVTAQIVYAVRHRPTSSTAVEA
jgi:hypothetical protein